MILPLIFIFISPSQHPSSFRFHQFLDLSSSADCAGLHWILLDSVNPDLVFFFSGISLQRRSRLYISRTPRTLVLGARQPFLDTISLGCIPAVGGYSLVNSECARGVCSEESPGTRLNIFFPYRGIVRRVTKRSSPELSIASSHLHKALTGNSFLSFFCDSPYTWTSR